MKKLLTPALLVSSLLPVFGLDIEGLPKPGEPRPLELPRPAEKTLGNGLRVIVVERGGLPLLSAELIIKTGTEADPASLSGLAKFTADLLSQGTTTRSAPEIAQQMEALGAALESSAGWDALRLKLSTLSAHTAEALAILGDVARNPAFAPEEIARQRRQALDELRLAWEQPGTLARMVAARVILASPYGQPQSGTLSSLPRLKRDDLRRFHQNHFVPANALLVLVGDIKAEDAFALAQKLFGDWATSSEKAAVSRKAGTPPAKTAVVSPRKAVLIDAPNAGQAAVYVGTPGLLRADPSYTIGEVANTVLGGGYSSRLNQEIRVKRGLSYGAGSRLMPGRETGLFGASCQTKPESAAEVVEVIRTELQRLTSEPLPADYFSSRQAVLTGNFSRDLATNEGYAGRLAEWALYGLDLETLNQRLTDLNAVTAEQTREFAAKHWALEALQVVVVGPAKLVEGPLRKLLPDLEVIPQRQLDLEKASLGAGPVRTGK